MTRIDYGKPRKYRAPRKYTEAMSAHWPATDKQYRYLRFLCSELGENPPEKLNRMQAADLIRAHKKTLEQRKK